MHVLAPHPWSWDLFYDPRVEFLLVARGEAEAEARPACHRIRVYIKKRWWPSLGIEVLKSILHIANYFETDLSTAIGDSHLLNWSWRHPQLTSMLEVTTPISSPRRSRHPTVLDFQNPSDTLEVSTRMRILM